MNNIFRLVNPALDRDMYIFKVTVFIKRTKFEYKTAFYSSLRMFNMYGSHALIHTTRSHRLCTHSQEIRNTGSPKLRCAFILSFTPAHSQG